MNEPAPQPAAAARGAWGVVRELGLAALAVGLLASSGTALAQAPATNPLPAAAVARIVAEPYMKVTNGATGAVELQVAARKLVPANGKGPVIWLTGASHIGETNYYAQLQKHLDAQALVLFEGVNASRKPAATNAPATPPEPAPAPATKTTERSSLQKDLAESLGLVFQLEAVNYTRPHFRNSDLSVAQLQELMEKEESPDPAAPESAKEKRKNEAFDTLLKAMEGDSLFGSLLKAGFKLVGGNPRFQAMTKLALIEALGSIRGDLSRMKSLPEDVQRLMEVLIQSRNDAVLKDLRAELKRAQPAASISIFYGAGHMDDLERRIRREFGYRPDGDLWLPAFSVDYTKAGLNVIEATFIRAMIQRQIQEMLPSEKPDGEK